MKEEMDLYKAGKVNWEFDSRDRAMHIGMSKQEINLYKAGNYRAINCCANIDFLYLLVAECVHMRTA